MGYKTRLFLVLWIPGVIGVLSLLLIDLHALISMLPLPPGETDDMPSPALLKIATVVQPTVLVTIAVFIGVLLAEKVGLHAPAAEAFARREEFFSKLKPQIVPGVIAGILCGAALIGLWLSFKPFLTAEFVSRAEEFNKFVPAAVRFLYGGFTEEILLRWGMMTFLVWVFWWIVQKGVGGPRGAYFIGAVLTSALLFGIGHLPVATILAGQLTPPLVVFVIAGNSLFGIVAGFLYWKKGLETAMIAHIFAHVVLVTAIALGA